MTLISYWKEIKYLSSQRKRWFCLGQVVKHENLVSNQLCFARENDERLVMESSGLRNLSLINYWKQKQFEKAAVLGFFFSPRGRRRRNAGIEVYQYLKYVGPSLPRSAPGFEPFNFWFYTSRPALINLPFQSSTQIWMDVLGSLGWGLKASFVLHNAEFFCLF